MHTDEYQRGFRNGWLDAKLGLTLQCSLHSNLAGYSDGYWDGQIAMMEGRPLYS